MSLDTANAAPASETLGFKAEVRELLQLMIHSLYSHREIFLRELISNASDANDKLRFLSLANPELMGEERELGIWIEHDGKAGTVSVRDNGIGLSREDAVSHLGTIAQAPARRSSSNSSLVTRRRIRSSSASSALASIRRLSWRTASRFSLARQAKRPAPACAGRRRPTESSRWRPLSVPSAVLPSCCI